MGDLDHLSLPFWWANWEPTGAAKWQKKAVKTGCYGRFEGASARLKSDPELISELESRIGKSNWKVERAI